MRVNKTVSAVLATTFAGAVALGGLTAGTAFAADEPRPQVGQEAPLPKAQQLQQQARVLGEAAGVLSPVADVIEAVLNAPEGRLAPAEADRHAKAVQEALAPLKEQTQQQRAGTPEQADPTAAAAVALEAQVDLLLQAAEAGDQQAVAEEAEATVQATVNLMTALVAGGQLPAADMKGLENVRQDVRQAPKAEQVPQLPENKLAPGVAEKELLGH